MLSAAISVPAASQQIGDKENGRVFVSGVCAECHAVRADEEKSPLPSAPRFEDVANSPGRTAIALTVWFRSSHPTMPNIVLSDTQMHDVIEYILSLKKE
ncbi:MAG: c-type cytochrome [Aestuariivirga sp.]